MIIESSHHPLVADVGRSFIREKLADNTKKPQQWLEDIRARGSLKDPACGPLLALLKHQGMQPSTAHAKMLEEATAHLLQRIGDVQPDKLRPLLDKVFPFVSVEALRPIVVKVLSILQPKSNLHILAEDDDVFWDLPLSVQQQVWEISVASLHKHCLPLLTSWFMEVDMMHTQVDMLYFVPGAASQGLLKSTTPSDLRQRSPVIKRLLEMIGTSRQIYKGVVELVRVRWTAAVQDARGAVSMDTDLLTSMRRHLLLALTSKRIDHVDRWDHVSKLLEVLDGCIRAREVSDANCAELKKTCNALMVQQSPPSAVRHVAAARSMTFMPPATKRQAAMLARSSGAAAAKPGASAAATTVHAAAGNGVTKRDGGTKRARGQHALAAAEGTEAPNSSAALATAGNSNTAAKSARSLEEETLMDNDLEDAGAIPEDDKDVEFALMDDDDDGEEDDDEDDCEDSEDDAARRKSGPKPPLKRQKLILDSDDEEEDEKQNEKATVPTAGASKAAPDVEAQSESVKGNTNKSMEPTAKGAAAVSGKAASAPEPKPNHPAVVSYFGEAEGSPTQSGGGEGGGEDWGLKGGGKRGRDRVFEDEDDWDDGARAACDDGESIQRSAADFSDTRKLLLDSAAILGEASVQHLLAFEIVRRLYTSVARQHVLPRSDSTVVFLLQLLQLGTAAPSIACGHSDAPRALPPAPPHALNVLLPILAGIIVDGRCAKLEQRPGGGGGVSTGAAVHMQEETVQRAASAIAHCTVARLLCEAFTLERLGKYESATCMLLLRILRTADELRFASQNGDAAGGGAQGGLGEARWGSGGPWAGAPFEAVRSLTSSPTRPPSSMNSPAATSGLMATQVGDGLGVQRPGLYSSQSLLSDRCQSGGVSSDSITQERTAFAASLARRLAAVAPGAPPLGAGGAARGGPAGPGTGRPGAGAVHGGSGGGGGGRGTGSGLDGAKAGAKGKRVPLCVLGDQLWKAALPFMVAGITESVVAHQQVVYALNTVGQVTLEYKCSKDPTSKAARDAQSVISAEVGGCINLLLSTSKTARSTAAARISQVMESSGVPACTLPWDSQLPDGVCHEYQKVLQRCPGASDHVNEQFREYLQLEPLPGSTHKNPAGDTDGENGNDKPVTAS